MINLREQAEVEMRRNIFESILNRKFKLNSQSVFNQVNMMKNKHKRTISAAKVKIIKPRPLNTLAALALIFCLFMHDQCLAQQIYRRRESTSARQAPQARAQPSAVSPPPQHDNVVAEMQVLCHSDAIVLQVNTNTPFNGMLYAKDAANGPNCLSEFHASTNMSFRVPLKSCGTLMAEVDDGVEFFNTVVVQPHMRLMTNQGKGYHIRCKYQTRERTIANTHFNVSAAFLMQNGPQSSTAPLLATASMPMCTMKIYRIDQDNVAESVRVGDKLVMVIEIDKQDMYGMRVTNCVVRDGMNKAEQQLINDSGCPVDETIMPKFEYEHNNTRAGVAFRAHKFPHTSSIYYQCNVRLCINGGGCEQVVCPSGGGAGASPSALAESPSAPVPATVAAAGGTTPPIPATTASSANGGGPRRKRFIGGAAAHKQDQAEQNEQTEPVPEPSELKLPSAAAAADMSFDVYSGLYVSDVDMSESNSGDPNGHQVLPPVGRDGSTSASNGTGRHNPEPSACLTMGKASLLVFVASLTSVALVLLIACQAGLLSANCSSEDKDDYEEHQARRQRMGNFHDLAQELDEQQRAQRQHARARQQRRNARINQPAGRNYNGSPRLLSSSTTSINGKSLASPFYAPSF